LLYLAVHNTQILAQAAVSETVGNAPTDVYPNQKVMQKNEVSAATRGVYKITLDYYYLQISLMDPRHPFFNYYSRDSRDTTVRRDTIVE
jgi:hypothetical protein